MVLVVEAKNRDRRLPRSFFGGDGWSRVNEDDSTSDGAAGSGWYRRVVGRKARTSNEEAAAIMIIMIGSTLNCILRLSAYCMYR